MPDLIDKKTKKKLKQILKNLPTRVELLYFTQGNACPMCSDQKKILEEIAALSPKVKLSEYDLTRNSDVVMKYHIQRIPATAIVGKKDYGIRFYGMTAGYEFSSLIEAIRITSQY